MSMPACIALRKPAAFGRRKRLGRDQRHAPGKFQRLLGEVVAWDHTLDHAELERRRRVDHIAETQQLAPALQSR
jgi:hypothetical protein